MDLKYKLMQTLIVMVWLLAHNYKKQCNWDAVSL